MIQLRARGTILHKSCRSQAPATCAWRADGRELMEERLFFGERYDFGTKIEISETKSK